jgi:hypothetical protein
MVAWPKSSCTNLACTPLPNSMVAHVCLRSWKRICGRPAFESKGLKERVTSSWRPTGVPTRVTNTSSVYAVIEIYQAIREATRSGSVKPLILLEDWMGAEEPDAEDHFSLLPGWPRAVVDAVEAERQLRAIDDYRSEEEYVSYACMQLAEYINVGLGGCRLGLLSLTSPDPNSSQPVKFLLRAAPRNLEDCAYAHLVTVIANGGEIRTCPGCGSRFAPKSGRQKYHSKSCANTSCSRRWRDSQVD